MLRKRVLHLVGVCLLGSGCQGVGTAVHNLVEETCLCTDNLVEKVQERRLAEAAWRHVQECPPGCAYSDDYACGFQEGFVDYLRSGGTGDPPPLPPRRYWKPRYETPQGHQAIQDWYAGFRHGATVAQQSGYRQWVVLPPPPPGPGAGHAPPPTPLPAPGPMAPAAPVPSSAPASEEPTLPMPRQVPPAPAGNDSPTGAEESETPATAPSPAEQPETH